MPLMNFRLTAPDKYGNYWLGRRTENEGEPCDPAIFPSKRLKGKNVVSQGCFILFLGSERGFLFDGPLLRPFKTARHALDYLNA